MLSWLALDGCLYDSTCATTLPRTTPSLAIAMAMVPAQGIGQSERTLLLQPDNREMNRRAPEVTHVRLETTRGIIRLEMRRTWAPHGVDRFYNLVRHGYYDNAAVFRVRAGMWAQFGINGDPKVAQLWRTRTIPDDPLPPAKTGSCFPARIPPPACSPYSE